MPPPGLSDLTAVAGARKQPGQASIFDRSFWFTYGANVAMMVAVSLLYRYADFVDALGGSEYQLGWIVGLGMVGSLFMRLAQGSGIDVYGARHIWLGSALLFIVSCFAHLAITSAHGPAIFCWRIVMQTSIAGFFGASISYISARHSTVRMAEAIGTLGTSGFIGTIMGTALGDFVLGSRGAAAPPQRMFLIAAASGAIALVFGWFATEGENRRLRRRRPPVGWLLARYHPGPVLLMGAAAGFGIGLPTVFVRPYALELGIKDLQVFFVPYMLVALVTRLCIRRLPALIGIRLMVLLGLSNLVGGMLLFLAVAKPWHMLAPALLIGIAHACMFPAVVAGGSGAFPARYRGLGTTLMLAMFDMGTLIGAPAFGGALALAEQFGLPRYPTAFLGVATILATSGASYALLTRRSPVHLGRAVRRAPSVAFERNAVPAPVCIRFEQAAQPPLPDNTTV
jgi:MFS family permease